MQNPFLYPGEGQALRKATGSTGNQISEPVTNSIPVGGYSETFGAHDCLEFMINFVFAAAATGNILIRKLGQNATTAGEAFDTMTVSAQTSANWNAGEALNGFYRFENNTDQAVIGYLQKRIN